MKEAVFSSKLSLIHETRKLSAILMLPFSKTYLAPSTIRLQYSFFIVSEYFCLTHTQSYFKGGGEGGKSVHITSFKPYLSILLVFYDTGLASILC